MVLVALVIKFARPSLNGKKPRLVGTTMEGIINRSVSNQVGLFKKGDSVTKNCWRHGSRNRMEPAYEI
jgi:hypothetical protein